MQLSRDGAKYTACKSVSREPIYVGNASKSSALDVMGLNIELIGHRIHKS